MDRPITTLFMLMSLDGKISTGATDEMDVDSDFPNITGVKEGLHQYYEIEQTTDLWSFNTGRVQAKMGVNEKKMPSKTPVSFVLLDNHHLTKHGVEYFCELSKQAVIITSNASHPAFNVKADNLHIIYQEQPSLLKALERLKAECGCERLTVQSGGTINSFRVNESENSTLSIFHIPDDDKSGFFLERGGPDTKEKKQSKRIPEGKYGFVEHSSGKEFYNKRAKLTSKRDSKFVDRAILIHPGNYIKDSKGCLLPGTTASKNNSGDYSVGASTIKTTMLEKYIKKNDWNVILTITNHF